jgi:hypothetical protein
MIAAISLIIPKLGLAGCKHVCLLRFGFIHRLVQGYLNSIVHVLFFFISLNANKKPAANNKVISPAKYGINSIIFFVV